MIYIIVTNEAERESFNNFLVINTELMASKKYKNIKQSVKNRLTRKCSKNINEIINSLKSIRLKKSSRLGFVGDYD